MSHHRDRMYLDPPPPEMKSPRGHWWCTTCDCLATECNAKTEHVWKIQWVETDEAELWVKGYGPL